MFLTEKGGLESGFMLAQYTAAALASENKVLVHPASADSIPSSANIEDHVSMGATATRQAEQILGHVEIIVAIELLSAAQGIDLQQRSSEGSVPLGKGTASAYELIRQKVSFMAIDSVLSTPIEEIRLLVAAGRIKEAVEDAIEKND